MAVIKRVGVMKSAYFGGLYGVFMGLLLGIVVVILTAILSLLISSSGVSDVMPDFLSMGFFSVIVFPLAFGVGGFLCGLIFTPVVNLILRMIRGIQLDIENDPVEVHQEYMPPTNPQPIPSIKV